MSDPSEDRRIAKNWREYLGESRESVRVFGWVWRELISGRSKYWARRMVPAALLFTVFAMAQAWVLRWVFDGLVGRRIRYIVVGLACYAGCMIVSQVFNWLMTYCREHMIDENCIQVDKRMCELFFEKSLGQHLRDSSVLSVGHMEKGRAKIHGVQEMLLFNGISAILDLVIAFIFIWCLSPVAGAGMTVLAANFAVWALYLNRRCIETCTPIESEFRKLSRHRVERWDKVERVKTCGRGPDEVEFMTGWHGRIFEDDRRFWLWYIARINCRAVIDKVVLMAVIGYGVWRAWQGDWTIGVLYPLFSWSRMFSDNLWRVSQIEQQLNWALPSVQALRDGLTMPADIVDRLDAAELPPDVRPRVEFRGVGHTYADAGLEEEAPKNGSSRPVLRDVSFTVEPGEKVALIGSSGAGKTTIMRLLQRYMDPQQGSVLVNGRDLRCWRQASWTAALGYIAQQPQVLDGTIRSNLLYGLTPAERERVADDDLWTLIRRLKIDFGDRLVDGLDTRVGRNGIKLSGGEAQRLMIGAAAMRRPRFMIIDEATSSLDSTTEKEVQRGLAEVLSGDMGALIIAHRLSTVRQLCTKFVVLKSSDELADGEPQVEAAAGSFEELYRVSPTFRRLADDQEVVIG